MKEEGMYKPVTAQDFHQAYALAVEGLPVDEATENFRDAAKPWEQLTSEQKERFAMMALRLNNMEKGKD